MRAFCGNPVSGCNSYGQTSFPYCSDGRVIRASASGAVDLGLIPGRVKPMIIKMVFTASLLDVQHYTDSVENKPASLLVVPFGNALSGIPPSWCC